jgi:hypothetical protein
LTVASGAKLTTSGDDKINLGGKLIVKEGGTFEIADGTDPDSSGGGGTITVESGATLIDKKPAGASLFGAYGVDSIVISAGSIAMIGDSVLIGPSSGNNKGQKLQLTSGEVKLTAAGYELAGDATLVSEFDIANSASLKITGTSTLTVADGAELRGYSSATNFLGLSDKNARIVLQSANSSLSRWANGTDSHTIPVIQDTAGVRLWDDTVIIDAYVSSRFTGPAILVKSDAYSATPPTPPGSQYGTWVKQ